MLCEKKRVLSFGLVLLATLSLSANQAGPPKDEMSGSASYIPNIGDKGFLHDYDSSLGTKAEVEAWVDPAAKAKFESYMFFGRKKIGAKSEKDSGSTMLRESSLKPHREAKEVIWLKDRTPGNVLATGRFVPAEPGVESSTSQTIPADSVLVELTGGTEKGKSVWVSAKHFRVPGSKEASFESAKRRVAANREARAVQRTMTLDEAADASKAVELQDTSSVSLPTESSSDSGMVSVRGYYRKDGTYVRPHMRRKPSR